MKSYDVTVSVGPNYQSKRQHELTVAEASRALDVGLLYVYVLIHKNWLKAKKNEDGHWRISATSIKAYKQRKGAKNGRRN